MHFKRWPKMHLRKTISKRIKRDKIRMKIPRFWIRFKIGQTILKMYGRLQCMQHWIWWWSLGWPTTLYKTDAHRYWCNILRGQRKWNWSVFQRLCLYYVLNIARNYDFPFFNHRIDWLRPRRSGYCVISATIPCCANVEMIIYAYFVAGDI